MTYDILKFLLDIFGFLFAIWGLLFPRIILASEIDPFFLKKRNYAYLFLCHILATRTELETRSLGILLFYYITFRISIKENRKMALFYSFYLFLAYESINFIFISIFYRAFPAAQIRASLLGQLLGIFFTEGLHMLLSLSALFIALFIFRYLKLDKELLKSEPFAKIIHSAIYSFSILSVLVMISYALIMLKNWFIYEFDIVISLFIFIGYLLNLLYIHRKQVEWLHKADIKQKEQENRNLNQLVVELGILYDEIRGFRHDFGGIVACLEPAIEQENINEIKQIYENVLLKMNKRLTRNDYTMFSFKRIEDIAFKNVLAQKMLQAKSLHIPFYLEVLTDIPIVEVPMLDAVRVLTILLDNALEETEKTANPKISVALAHEHHHTTVIIQNTRQQNKIDKRKIWEQGYSTKGNNRGNGLPILLNIIHTLENIEIETTIEEETFTQTLIFRKKGAY